jgi:hypothetical protein
MPSACGLALEYLTVAQAGHVGRRAGVVDEDEFAGIEFQEPGFAPLQDVGPIPCRGRGLF